MLEPPTPAKGEVVVSTDAPTRPVLFELLQTIRAAVGALLDVADAAAEAITKRIEGRT
jgi:hypothetical protein